jgi:hypothetical protein
MRELDKAAWNGIGFGRRRVTWADWFGIIEAPMLGSLALPSFYC